MNPSLPDGKRTLQINVALDLRRVLAALRIGGRDPALRWADGPGGTGCDWAIYTQEGPAALEIRRPSVASMQVRAWGPGSTKALESVESLLGLSDDAESFETDNSAVRALQRRSVGLRLPRVLDVSSLLTPIVLQQLVTAQEAAHTYRRLIERHGVDAPGPMLLRLLPPARQLSDLSRAAYQACGALGRQAETIKRLNFRAGRMNAVLGMNATDAMRRLTALPGLGPWTAGMAMLRGLGFADVAPTGDYHLANEVVYALTGRPRGTDTEMEQLLEPFAPHRGRVALMLHIGAMRAPRFGPKVALTHRGR